MQYPRLRKFRDDATTAPLLASRAMGFIGGFYAVEAEAKAAKKKGAALLAHRQAHARPIAERFKAWLDQHIDDLLETNPVRKAMKYYLNHWAALTRFLTDPKVELDNNWSERALRKIALLRNNSLYAGGIEGAERLCTQAPNTDLASFIELRLQRDLSTHDPVDTARAAVRAVVRRHLRSGVERRRVAAQLGWSERTLARRLAAEGQTFQQVVNDVRFESASNWLRSLTVDAVAKRLGFADVRSFRRAFRRWTGQTPTAWRQGLAAG